MKFGFKSYNSWDPLKKVVVGSAFTSGWFNDHPDPLVRDAMTKVNEETREDLDNLAHVLQERGVEVYRTPDQTLDHGKVMYSVAEYMDQTGEIPKCRMSPRDEFIVLGENLIMGRPGNGYPMWCDPKFDLFEPAPWAGCEDVLDVCWDKDSPWHISHFDMQDDEKPRFDGPCMVRTGRDITVDVQIKNAAGHTFCDRWLQAYNQEFGYNFRGHKVRFGRHSDGLMSIPRPGVILSSVAVTDYENTYPGWTVIRAPKPKNEYIEKFWDIKNNSKYIDDNGFMHKKYWVAGEEGNAALTEFIKVHMNKNVGYAYETNFDVNTLSIDENTVLTSGYNAQVEKDLNKLGIEVIVTPMRHRYFWDGGIHCNTLDLYRDGEMTDLFPERSDVGLDFGSPYDDGMAQKDNNRDL